MFTIVNFSNSTKAKIVNAGNNRYLTRKVDGKRISVVQVRNKTKQVDDFQLFKTSHSNICYTNETLRIKERNFLQTDISETDLRDTKLVQLFVLDSRGMFEHLKQRTIKLSHRKIAER